MMFSASDEKNSFSSVFHDIDHQPFLQRSLSAPAIAENVSDAQIPHLDDFDVSISEQGSTFYSNGPSRLNPRMPKPIRPFHQQNNDLLPGFESSNFIGSDALHKSLLSSLMIDTKPMTPVDKIQEDFPSTPSAVYSSRLSKISEAESEGRSRLISDDENTRPILSRETSYSSLINTTSSSALANATSLNIGDVVVGSSRTIGRSEGGRGPVISPVRAKTPSKSQQVLVDEDAVAAVHSVFLAGIDDQSAEEADKQQLMALGNPEKQSGSTSTQSLGARHHQGHQPSGNNAYHPSTANMARGGGNKGLKAMGTLSGNGGNLGAANENGGMMYTTNMLGHNLGGGMGPMVVTSVNGEMGSAGGALGPFLRAQHMVANPPGTVSFTDSMGMTMTASPQQLLQLQQQSNLGLQQNPNPMGQAMLQQHAHFYMQQQPSMMAGQLHGGLQHHVMGGGHSVQGGVNAGGSVYMDNIYYRLSDQNMLVFQQQAQLQQQSEQMMYGQAGSEGLGAVVGMSSASMNDPSLYNPYIPGTHTHNPAYWTGGGPVSGGSDSGHVLLSGRGDSVGRRMVPQFQQSGGLQQQLPMGMNAGSMVATQQAGMGSTQAQLNYSPAQGPNQVVQQGPGMNQQSAQYHMNQGGGMGLGRNSSSPGPFGISGGSGIAGTMAGGQMGLLGGMMQGGNGAPSSGAALAGNDGASVAPRAGDAYADIDGHVVVTGDGRLMSPPPDAMHGNGGGVNGIDVEGLHIGGQQVVGGGHVNNGAVNSRHGVGHRDRTVDHSSSSSHHGGGGGGRHNSGGNNRGADRDRDRDRGGGRREGGRGGGTTNTVRNPMVDDFRNTYGKSRNWELKDLAGHVVAFCQDQHGSRFIQQRLEVSSDDEKQVVFDEVIPCAHSLMTDVFGNYVIQKLFEYGAPEQCETLAALLTGHTVPLALQMYGCRVIQKALEYVSMQRLVTLVAEFEGAQVLRCVHDQNGNHVIQKCIEVVSRVAKDAPADVAEYLNSRIQFIIQSFQGRVRELSMHPYGCRVVQRILEHCSDSQKSGLLEELRLCCIELMQDQYGNYVIQHVMQHGWEADRAILMREVQEHLLEFSQHKFASNVVEKCLQYSNKKDRDEMIWTIIKVTFDMNDPVDAKTGHCALESMVRDPYGNYVVQKVIDVSDERQRGAIIRYVRENIVQLRRYTYGKHILLRLEKASGEKF